MIIKVNEKVFNVIDKLEADGSDREFYRITWNNNSAIYVKPSIGDVGRKEANSFFRIGLHLLNKGVNVPKIYDYDINSGEIILEDLGNKRLFDHYHDVRKSFEDMKEIFNSVIIELVKFQYLGREGFDTSWCYDTSIYDKEMVYYREIRYFIDRFLIGLMDFSWDELEKLDYELRSILDRLDGYKLEYLIHRDFQSRNIMIKGDEVKIIDFQGARIGPRCYDLASIIIDPYISIDWDKWDYLLEVYANEVVRVWHDKVGKIKDEFYLLALFRNLQILGAFSYLYKIKGKIFFKQYIKRALLTLSHVVNLLKLDLYEFNKKIDMSINKIDTVLNDV